MHVLADVPIGEVARFLEVFSSEGLAKRKEHGCLGTRVLVPADEAGRVLVLLEWGSLDDFEAFRTDPTAPPIMRKGGAQGPPTFTVLDRIVDFPA
jgi:heme-degrading monooxygenase HmoA